MARRGIPWYFGARIFLGAGAFSGPFAFSVSYTFPGVVLRTKRWEEPTEPRHEPLALENEKDVLRHYYEGSQLPSPMGGFLAVIHVQTESDGSGTVIFECLSSSLRFKLPIKKATRTERAKVKEHMEGGQDPACPRCHDRRLSRVGPNWVCPSCGVRYAKAV